MLNLWETKNDIPNIKAAQKSIYPTSFSSAPTCGTSKERTLGKGTETCVLMDQLSYGFVFGWLLWTGKGPVLTTAFTTTDNSFKSISRNI